MTLRKTWHQLDVEECDNFTFRVQSESGRGTYFVDALADGGLGRCNCPDFLCRIAPIYSGKKNAPAGVPHWISACKHQLRVKLHIADKLIAEMVKQKGYRPHDGP